MWRPRAADEPVTPHTHVHAAAMLTRGGLALCCLLLLCLPCTWSSSSRAVSSVAAMGQQAAAARTRRALSNATWGCQEGCYARGNCNTVEMRCECPLGFGGKLGAWMKDVEVSGEPEKAREVPTSTTVSLAMTTVTLCSHISVEHSAADF